MPFPTRVLLHPAGWPVIFLYDWETVLLRLKYFAQKGPDYLTLELEDGSYVQCAGEKRRLVVESRSYSSDRQFRHLAWGKGALRHVADSVQCVDGIVSADASQILEMRDARIIIRSIVESSAPPSLYTATDITDRFAALPEGVEVRHDAWRWPVNPPRK